MFVLHHELDMSASEEHSLISIKSTNNKSHNAALHCAIMCSVYLCGDKYMNIKSTLLEAIGEDGKKREPLQLSYAYTTPWGSAPSVWQREITYSIFKGGFP